MLSARYRVEDSPWGPGRYGFLAGNDGRRLSALRWALSSPQSRAVFWAGGYGLLRLVPALLPLIPDRYATSEAPDCWLFGHHGAACAVCAATAGVDSWAGGDAAWRASGRRCRGAVGTARRSPARRRPSSICSRSTKRREVAMR